MEIVRARGSAREAEAGRGEAALSAGRGEAALIARGKPFVVARGDLEADVVAAETSIGLFPEDSIVRPGKGEDWRFALCLSALCLRRAVRTTCRRRAVRTMVAALAGLMILVLIWAFY